MTKKFEITVRYSGLYTYVAEAESREAAIEAAEHAEDDPSDKEILDSLGFEFDAHEIDEDGYLLPNRAQEKACSDCYFSKWQSYRWICYNEKAFNPDVEVFTTDPPFQACLDVACDLWQPEGHDKRSMSFEALKKQKDD